MVGKVGQFIEVPRSVWLYHSCVFHAPVSAGLQNTVCIFRLGAYRPEPAVDQAGLPYPAALVADTGLFPVSAAPYVQSQLACRSLSPGWLETVPYPGQRNQQSVAYKSSIQSTTLPT